MNEHQNLTISLSFKTGNSGGETGWFLTVPDPTRENHTWAVAPTLVPAAVAVAVARTIDAALALPRTEGEPGPMEAQVLAQHDRVAEDLRSTIARKQATLDSIERDEATLTALVASLGVDPQQGDTQQDETGQQ